MTAVKVGRSRPRGGALVDASVPLLYTIDEAASLFGVSKHWFYEGIRDGEIYPTDLARTTDPQRHKWRISAEELHRLIRARTAA